MTEPDATPPLPPPHLVARRRTLRAIATFEAVKGVTAIAAALGFLRLLHHDLHQIALSLIGRIGLDPGSRYPTMLLDHLDALRDANLQSLLLVVAGYVLIRFAEAYGLWKERTWGEWLGAVSGALYVPFELQHLIHRPSLATVVVLLANVVVVGFLAWQLVRRLRGRQP